MDATAFDLIKRRHSVRTYTGKNLSSDTTQEIRKILSTHHHGPFGSKVRFEFVTPKDANIDDMKAFGTYGLIRHATHFIIGAVLRENEMSVVDFGFELEDIILELTRMNLGTCWLGGALHRSRLSDFLHLSNDELIPAVTPVGEAADKRAIADRLIRWMAKSENRFSSEKIFFSGSDKNPLILDNEKLGPYALALEAVRLGPSASNKQPWRVIYQEHPEGKYHFFLNEDRLYNKAIPGLKIQELDMGIAFCHFERVLASLNVKGKWKILNDEKIKALAPGWRYFASWGEVDVKVEAKE